MILPKVPQSREEVSLPWIQEILKQEPFEVLSMTWNNTSDSVGGGVGCLSSLERVSLTVLEHGEELKELSLILKTPPSLNNLPLRNFVLSEGFCQREFQMYSKMLPSWSKFQESRNTPEKYRFRHPHCYYSAEEGSGTEYKMVLLLEDMSTSGYSTSPHGYRKGLRWAQAKQVVKEMALFHAVGMAYKEEVGLKHYTGPDYDWLYTHSNDQSVLDTFLRSGLNATCDMLRKQPCSSSIPSGLISDLESFHDIPRLQELSFPRGSRAGTITHADLHTHNVMLNDEGGVALLDFQGCSYSSPMTDLSFFLLLCCDPDLYTTHLRDILTLYGDTFASAIHAMDCEERVAYPIQEIVEDYHASLVNSVIHIVLGSLNWCFNPKMTSPQTQERYKEALLDAFHRCGGQIRLEGVEQWANYFSREGAYGNIAAEE